MMPPNFVVDRIKGCLANIKLDANPGYPWCLYANTKGGVVEALGEDAIIYLVWERIKALDTMVPSRYTAAGAVLENCVDPIRIFVKNELHSEEKVQQGRMRLIMNLSMIDELVERFLCSDQNHMEIDQWSSIPSKPGMGQHDQGLQELINNMSAFTNPVQTDVSGFDWSVKGWMLELEAEARIELSGARWSVDETQSSNFARILRNRVRCLSQAVIVLSDGRVFIQDKPGIQKSGSYNTSSTNSRIRWMLAKLVGAENAMVMGDDAIEEFAAGAEAKYAEFGLKLKEYTRSNLEEGLEFCGTLFKREVSQCTPVRWAKMLANLLHKTYRSDAERVELLVAFEHEMRHSPHLKLAREIIELSGW